MRDFVFYTHLGATLIFVTLIVFLLAISIKKLITKQEFTQFDKKHSAWTLVFLYIQSAQGLYLYFTNPKNFADGVADPAELSQNIFSRFWEVEHFLMMFFTLAIAQLGYISTTKSAPGKKHKLRFIYFFGVFVMIGISLILAHYK